MTDAQNPLSMLANAATPAEPVNPTILQTQTKIYQNYMAEKAKNFQAETNSILSFVNQFSTWHLAMVYPLVFNSKSVSHIPDDALLSIRSVIEEEIKKRHPPAPLAPLPMPPLAPLPPVAVLMGPPADRIFLPRHPPANQTAPQIAPSSTKPTIRSMSGIGAAAPTAATAKKQT